MATATAATPRPGESLTTSSGCRVRLLAWAGEGSFARVYRAQLAGESGVCAVKIAKPEVLEAAERLRAQEGVLRAVRHPRLVRLLDGGASSSPFLVLEWLEGETCRDLLEARRRLPLRQALEVMEAALEGLAALHAAGEVHGDLRLGNLILTPSRGLVLTDPLGSGDGTPATDLHAWGRLLAELLTGATAKQLSAASGFRPEVARLWEQSQAVHPPRAVDIASTVAALRRSL